MAHIKIIDSVAACKIEVLSDLYSMSDIAIIEVLNAYGVLSVCNKRVYDDFSYLAAKRVMDKIKSNKFVFVIDSD